MRLTLLASLAILTLAFASTSAQDKALDHPYYPLRVGDQWTYRSGKDSVVVAVDKAVAVAAPTGGAKTPPIHGFALKLTGGPNEYAEEVAVLPDGVYRLSSGGKALTPPLRFLKLPINPGDTWKVDSKTEQGKRIRGEFVAGSETIVVAVSGKELELKTITVFSKNMTVGDDDITVKYWFAERIGMVKQQAKTGKHEQTLELRSFKLVR